MSFEASLKSLLGAAGVAALVGERAYPLKLPQSATKPAVTYTRVAGLPANDLDGDDGDLINVRLQLDCWAEQFDDVRAVAEAVRAAIMASTSLTGLVNFDQDFYEDDTKLYRTMLDCSFWYRTT
jgi:hypothetical protein